MTIQLNKTLIAAIIMACISGGMLFPAYGAERPAESYTRMHRESSSSTVTVEETHEKSSRTTTHSDISIQTPSASGMGAVLFPYMAKNKLPAPVQSLRKTVRSEYNVNYEQGVLALYKENGKWGLLGTDGAVLLPASYKKLSYAGQGVFLSVKGNKTAYIDKTGTAVTLPVSENESGGPVFFQEKGRYGIRDANGIVVSEPVYKEILTPFSEGIAFVRNAAGRKVAIDHTGKELFAVPYDRIFPYRDGLAEYQRKINHFNWGLLAGALVGSAVNSGYYAGEIEPLTYDGVKRGYIDRTGRVVIDSRLDEVYPMTAWGTFVKDKGLLAFVGRDGKYIIEPGRYEVGPGMMDDWNGMVSLKDKESGGLGVFSLSDGRQILPFQYEKVDFLGADRMFLKRGNQCFLVNQETGQVVREWQEMVNITPYLEDSYAWCQIGKKYEIIDAEGQTVYTAPEGGIKVVLSFRHGVSAVKSGDVWGILNSKGEWLIRPQYKEIEIL